MYALKMSNGSVVGRMSLVQAVLKLRENENVITVLRVREGLPTRIWGDVFEDRW